MHITNVMADEDHDDLFFAPAAQLKMVVDRGHLEDALAVGQLEIRHLQDDGKRLA